MIKVSVVIPVYNMETYIEECLDSIFSQTLKEIEVLCIDDGSTDRSYEILKKYREKYKNLIVFRQQNQGAGIARNKGIQCANVEYICFMDPDDYYAQEQALELLYRNAKENHAVICGGNIVGVLQNGMLERQGRWFSENKMISFKDYGNYFYYTTYIFRLELLRKNNILFPPYRRYQDPPFLLAAMIAAQEFYAINEVIYTYRIGYKEVKFSLPVVIDVLKGIRDCFTMAKENNLIKVYDEQLKNILSVHLAKIYPYAYENQKEIWNLIDEIHEISMEWVGEISDIFTNLETLKDYTKQIKDRRDDMIAQCHAAQEVVIYGAGKAGMYFFQNYGKECKCLSGFAVSKKEKEEFIEGYEVKEIGNYSRDALIIVAVGKRYTQEILNNLERMYFKNVCSIDYTELKMVENVL